MGIITVVDLGCSICMGRYSKARAISSFASYLYKEHFELDINNSLLKQNLKPETPLFYDPITNKFVTGLPGPIMASKRILEVLSDIHEKAFVDKYGYKPYPDISELSIRILEPYLVFNTLYKVDRYMFHVGDIVEEVLEKDLSVLERINIVRNATE